MEIILGVATALLAVACVTVIIRSMELTSSNNTLAERNTTLQRDLKKVQSQLDSQANKYQAKAQEVAKTGTKSKDQKQRISRMSEELQAERGELKRSRERVQEFSGELNRLRISREKLREEMATLKERSAVPQATPEPVMDQAMETSDVEAAHPVEREERAPQKKGPGRLERDLDKAEAFISKLKRRLVETTGQLRAVERKNEHNRRAYIITGLQLDVLQDENYVLKHGTPPPFSQAEKQQKRAALRPEDENVVVVDRDAAPIELPDVDELEAQAEEAHRIAQEEAAEAAAIAEAEAEVAEAAAVAEAEAEAEVAAAEAAAAAEAEAAAEEVETAAEVEAAEVEPAAEEQTGTVRRRKAKASTAPAVEA